MSDDTTTLSWTGGKSFKIDANQVGKLTLTANWTPNKITITLNKMVVLAGQPNSIILME